jgi:hypothetical protein
VPSGIARWKWICVFYWVFAAKDNGQTASAHMAKKPTLRISDCQDGLISLLGINLSLSLAIAFFL